MARRVPEKVGSGEGCSIFYLELTGEAVQIRKTEANAISIYIPVTDSFAQSANFSC